MMGSWVFAWIRQHRPIYLGLLGGLVPVKFTILGLVGMLFLILPGAACGKRDHAKPAGRESSLTLPTKNSLRVLYYKAGEKTEITMDSLLYARVRRFVDTLFLDASETLKLLVDDERIEELKMHETVLEIVFDKTDSLRSERLGIFPSRKVLVPFSGDFVGDVESPIITIFAGDTDGYSSGPLRNPKGYPTLMELKSLVERAFHK